MDRSGVRADRLRRGRRSLPCPACRCSPACSSPRWSRQGAERAAEGGPRTPRRQRARLGDELLAASGSHDLVVVAAPNRTHVPLALAALDAGLHVVVDKPLAASVTDAERLAAAASSSGLVAAVFHSRRWDGDFLTLQRLVREGQLGEWRSSRASSVGGFVGALRLVAREAPIRRTRAACSSTSARI